MQANIRKQRGMSMLAIMLICIALILAVIGGMKVAPAYLEFMNVKKAVAGIAQSGEGRGSVAEVKRAFDKRAQVDDIQVITGADLEVTKENGEIVISFAYPKKIHLFGNLSLYFDFAGSSSGSGG